ncbi:MAG TPA: hypothetical protein VLA96_04200 [Terriglobales bacterium]|jgi:hypothetical protein|nr:hypothetical protein [Terriglobales bacterium]
MSTIEDVSKAEERMNHAKDALLGYLERARGKTIDREEYRRLQQRVKAANDRFMRALAELDR